MLQNLEKLAAAIESSMAVIMANRSFRDSGSTMSHPQFGPQVFASIAGVLDECVAFVFTEGFVLTSRE